MGLRGRPCGKGAGWCAGREEAPWKQLVCHEARDSDQQRSWVRPQHVGTEFGYVLVVTASVHQAIEKAVSSD